MQIKSKNHKMNKNMIQTSFIERLAEKCDLKSYFL